jgi:hypothetical protein
MVQTSEYSVLSEQIKGLTTLINARFTETHERLDKINGKVAKHDEQITEALIERARNREEQKNVVSNHILTCPVSKDLTGLKKTLDDLNFFIRHPKLFIGILVTIVIITLATFMENNPFAVFKNYKQPISTEQTK